MVQTLDQKIALVRFAIVELKQITGVYNGYPRVMCPHILGTTTEGVWKCFAWQFAGGSSKPHQLPMWRDLVLDNIDDLTSQAGDWHRGWVTGQREQRSVDVIDTVVDPDHAAEIRQILLPRTPGRRFRR